MRFKLSPFALALVAGLALSGCGSDKEDAAAPSATTDAAVAAAPAAPAATALPPPPQLNARSFIVMDHESGRVLAAFEPDSRQEPASLTKLMTAYVVFHSLKEGRIKLGDLVTVSENAWRQASPKLGGSAMYIEVGTQVSVENLLQGMIVQSGNDATVALAEHVAGTEATFVQMMNSFAKQLGLTGSHFTDAAGMPNPEQYITARDAAQLAHALIREFPEYYRWYSQKEFTWNDITQQNRNGLLWRDPTVDGVKTGHTKTAGYCLVTSAKRGDMRLVSAVMGTDSMRAREDASAALLNYGFNFFETRRIYAAGQPLTTMRVWKGRQDQVGLALKRDLYVTSQRGHVSNVKAEFELPETLLAPLAANKPVGKTRVVVDGATIATYDLYPATDVAEAGFFGRAWDSLRLLFN
jgi:serine-type D-Ala-D-Ala carboxypeptidase (penicillin-binding protein 5/6)